MIPWVKTNAGDSIVVVPMQHVITVVEAEEDSEVVESYMKFVRSKLQSSSKKTPKTGGFKTTVEKARKELEKLYNIESKEARIVLLNSGRVIIHKIQIVSSCQFLHFMIQY